MYWTDHYVVDLEKVTTLDDLKRLIAAMQLSFEPDDPNLKNIKDLVRREPKHPAGAVMDRF